MNVQYIISILLALVIGYLAGRCLTRHADTPRQKLMNLSIGFIPARAVHAAAQLGLADHLKQPKTVQELARELSLNTDMLDGLLRLLVSHGVFDRRADGKIALNSMSEYLRSDVPDSMLKSSMFDTYRWGSFAKLPEQVKSGKPAVEIMFDKHYFDLIKTDPVASKIFHDEMTALTSQENTAIAQSFDFTKYPSVIDIGGGQGSLLATILAKNTKARGVLFDLPEGVRMLDPRIEACVEEGRCSVIEGSFFETIPHNISLYVLKRVIHDWSNEKAIEILKNIAQAMPADGTLLIIEGVMPDDNKLSLMKEVDLFLRVNFGGKVRTQKEFEALLDAAGLKLKKIVPTGSMVSIIEVAQK